MRHPALAARQTADCLSPPPTCRAQTRRLTQDISRCSGGWVLSSVGVAQGINVGRRGGQALQEVSPPFLGHATSLCVHGGKCIFMKASPFLASQPPALHFSAASLQCFQAMLCHTGQCYVARHTRTGHADLSQEPLILGSTIPHGKGTRLIHDLLIGSLHGTELRRVEYLIPKISLRA